MTSSPEVKRFIRVIILALLVLAVAIWNGLRLGETIFFWKTLEHYGAHPLYIAISGGAWMIACFLLVRGLWLGKAWGWAAALVGSVGYSIWYWFDRFLLQKPHANWPFIMIIDFVFLLLIQSILLSRKTRCFFQRDTYERKPQTPTIS